MSISVEAVKPNYSFSKGNNGSTLHEQVFMANSCGFPILDALINATIPETIQTEPLKPFKFEEGLMEKKQMIDHMKYMGVNNIVFKSFIGMGN